MKTYKVLRAIPEVFSLAGNDYTPFIVGADPAVMMRDSWVRVGAHLGHAIASVELDMACEKEREWNGKTKGSNEVAANCRASL